MVLTTRAKYGTVQTNHNQHNCQKTNIKSQNCVQNSALYTKLFTVPNNRKLNHVCLLNLYFKAKYINHFKQCSLFDLGYDNNIFTVIIFNNMEEYIEKLLMPYIKRYCTPPQNNSDKIWKYLFVLQRFMTSFVLFLFKLFFHSQ